MKTQKFKVGDIYIIKHAWGDISDFWEMADDDKTTFAIIEKFNKVYIYFKIQYVGNKQFGKVYKKTITNFLKKYKLKKFTPFKIDKETIKNYLNE